MTETTKKCTRCLEEKPITEFNFKDKLPGRRQIYCRDCARTQVRRHYQAHVTYYVRKARKYRKQLKQESRACILNYLTFHPCIDCGEDDPVCLDLDQVRGIKPMKVSRMVRLGYSWDAKRRSLWLSAPGGKPL
jgi:hypothetical protein